MGKGSFVAINIFIWIIILFVFFIFSRYFLVSLIKLYTNVKDPKRGTRQFYSTIISLISDSKVLYLYYSPPSSEVCSLSSVNQEKNVGHR